jgi:hypothetical protein
VYGLYGLCTQRRREIVRKVSDVLVAEPYGLPRSSLWPISPSAYQPNSCLEHCSYHFSDSFRRGVLRSYSANLVPCGTYIPSRRSKIQLLRVT